MARISKPKSQKRGPRSKAELGAVYIHGIGAQAPAEQTKSTWDIALFQRDMGERTTMAYWADIRHGDESRTRRLALDGPSAPAAIDHRLRRAQRAR